MENALSLMAFLDLLEEGELTSFEIYNHLETLSSNFRPEKLKLLLNDVELQRHIRRESFIDQNRIRIAQIKDQYKKENKEIPQISLVTKDGKNLGTIDDDDKILNYEITFRFQPFRELESMIRAKLKELAESQETPKRPSPKPAPDRGLEHFLSDKGIKYFSIIKEACQSKVLKKKDLVSFLYALEDLGLLNQKVNSIEISAIWRALTTTFGKELVGERGNLSKYRNMINSESEVGKGEIRPFKNYINSQILEAEKKESANK